MQPGRFDSLVRSFGIFGTRRAVARLLAMFPLAGTAFLLRAEDDGSAKRRHHRKTKRHRVSRRDGIRELRKKKKKKCAAAGQTRSKKRKQCCAGLVPDGSGVCAQPVSMSPPPPPGPPPPGPPPPLPPPPPGCADPCPACTTCAGDGTCRPCTGCCDGGTCVARCGACQTCDGSGQCISCPECCDGDTCVPECGDCKTCLAGQCGPCPGCCDGVKCVSDCLSCNVCESGKCTPCVAFGQICCGGTCVSGICCADVECGPKGDTCTGHACFCGGSATCTGGSEIQCCSGSCIDTNTQRTHCGSCGHTCGSNQLCVDGECHDCTVTCPGGTCDGTALQNALSAGGIVYACPGRYGGRFDVNAVNMTLIGAGNGNDPLFDTILDGQAIGRTLLMRGAKAELRRVRITGGQVNDFGGGLLNICDFLTLRACTISGNTSLRDQILTRGVGGGIFNGGGRRLVMTNCTVTDNSSVNTTSGNAYGGGIYNDGDLELAACQIESNRANTDGGGLYNGVGVASLTDCTVTDNTLTFALTINFGSGIRAEGSVTLRDSFVWANRPNQDCLGDISVEGEGGCGVSPAP